MPWFRRKKKQQEEAAPAEQAAAQEAPPAEPAEQPTSEAPAADGEAAKRKRRRGTRGGRGRKKPGEAAQPSAEAESEPALKAPAKEKAPAEKAPAKRAKRPERKSSDRAGRSSSTRRRQPPRRAPLPAAKRELVISVDVGEQRVAVLEDGRVAEVYLERPERRSIAGNIYLGTVDNVLPGMEAAFVEIGLEKNGFLYVDEIVVPELEGKRHGKKITDLISRGQTLLVQAVKDPMKTKGARLTTEISLPGRFLVYVPNGEGLGVSRRLDDAERTRLKDILKEIAPKEGGVIVRTAAEGASAEDVERDLVFLQRLWKTIQTRAKQASPPSLVYQEAELPLRVVRDLFAGDFEAAYIDHDKTHRRIVGYLKKTSPHMLERVHRHRDKESLFEAHGVEAEIRSTLERRVDLPSGGYLIFDYAEAFTVIDVNTGRFVGSRSKSSNARLEDTIVKNNLEAVKEVVRQLRLRDIGGIIVIDFIDMANPKNRETVEEALRSELERDRTKTYVVEISPLGLVEMTRQNVTDGPREILTRKCPTCAGDGIVVSERTFAMDAERKLRTLAAGSRSQAFTVELHPRTLALVVGEGGRRLAEIDAEARKRFFLTAPTGNGHIHYDHFHVVAEGKRDDLAPTAPVAEDAELDVKLVEVDRHDATAGVGKVDGFDVVVAGASKLVGKKTKVRVVRVLETAAYGEPMGGPEVDPAITFEGEAEKPTRAPSRAKKPVEALDEVEAVARGRGSRARRGRGGRRGGRRRRGCDGRRRAGEEAHPARLARRPRAEEAGGSRGRRGRWGGRACRGHCCGRGRRARGIRAAEARVHVSPQACAEDPRPRTRARHRVDLRCRLHERRRAGARRGRRRACGGGGDGDGRRCCRGRAQGEAEDTARHARRPKPQAQARRGRGRRRQRHRARARARTRARSGGLRAAARGGAGR